MRRRLKTKTDQVKRSADQMWNCHGKFFLPMTLLCLTLAGPCLAIAAPAEKQPWEKPRSIADFQSLLDHSPFSLPTAEESSPLSDRYALTGIVTIGGEEEVFVFDRTDQSREMLTHKPNQKNMALVSLVREGDKPPQKATIRVGGDTGTITYLAAAPQAAPPPGPQVGGPNPLMPRLPALPVPAGAPNAPGVIVGPRPPGITPQTRRIIRRPPVAPPSAQVPTP